MIGTAEGLIAYAAARGITVGAEEAPVLLVKATDYMNTFNWVGKLPTGQEDSWPRKLNETEDAVTPQNIVTATYRIATVIGEGTELQAVGGGARVTQESVSGAVSVTYAEGTVNDAVTIPGFSNLIAEWLAAPLNTGINFSVMRG